MAAAVMASGEARRNEEIFKSVFPEPNFTTATPESTPNIGAFTSPGRPFGGFSTPANVVDETVQFNRAWSTATRYLTLPPGPDKKDISADSESFQALVYLLGSPTSKRDLLAWYTNEASLHFRQFVLPDLQEWLRPIEPSEAHRLLTSILKILQRAQYHYLHRLRPSGGSRRSQQRIDSLHGFSDQVKRNLHVLFLHTLHRQRLQTALTRVMLRHMKTSLESGANPERCFKGNQCHCKLDCEGFPFAELYEVGLGGPLGERAFAHAVHAFLNGPAIERRCFEVDWNGQQSIMEKLQDWTEQHFNVFVEQALAALTKNPSYRLSEQDAWQFKVMAITNLGRLRTLSLFNYVKTWPDSTGAILDIRSYINTKEGTGAGSLSEKAYVCQSFTDQIQRRLLHAGASTSDILSIYVNVIHVFRTLDSRGVLLGKVVAPIRTYLRTRDDAVSIIAASFLAEVNEDGNVIATDMDKVCPDIALAVVGSALEDSRDSKLLNWDDLEWVPDPIDAGPDYRSSKSEDVVAYVLGLFELEEFIKEVTTVLAQQLLHANDFEYVRETRLVELLKSRLEAAKLQAAEVMLKDVHDSVSLGKRINPSALYQKNAASAPSPKEIQAAIPEDGITLPSLYKLFDDRMKRSEFIAAVKLVSHRRDDLFFPKRTRSSPRATRSSERNQDPQTDFKVQILSSFFWPQLRTDEFNMPRSLEPLRKNFEHRFGALGNQRKLRFRPALARVSLRLDLEDRTVEESDLPGWRASVIDAFASEDSTTGGLSTKRDNAQGLTAEQLTEALGMEEELVHDALSFWIGRRVLYKSGPDTYAILERLDSETSALHQWQQQDQPAEQVSAVRSQDAMLREGAPMFQTFIANMLQNGGPKEVGGMMGITNVMKMVNPAFIYGDDEVLWLLGEMEGRGEVKRNGEMWAAA